jgi:hypothetical protein
MNHNIMDLLTKNPPNPIRFLGEKLKSSSIGKFVANPEIALQTLTV